MKYAALIFRNLTWISQTLFFFKSQFAVILGLGLIAAFGRAAQLGAFGEVSSGFHVCLEVLIQSSRLLIFIYTLGLTNVRRAIFGVRDLFANKNIRTANWQIAIQKIRSEWPSLLANLFIYLLIALVINKLIDYAAYQTCLYYKLKSSEIISNKSSEWVIILFFKNLSVIPLTLVFNALFLLWITNKKASSF